MAAVYLTVITFSACPKSRDDAHARAMAERVKTECLHAWKNSERYAWGSGRESGASEITPIFWATKEFGSLCFGWERHYSLAPQCAPTA